MPQKKRYESRAEQQRAYRQRKAEPTTPECTPIARDRPTGVEQYVEQQLEQTREHMKTFRAPEKTNPEARRQRLERAEAYARWRWEAFEAGEVFSL